MLLNEMNILRTIGMYPEYSVNEIADEVECTSRTVKKHIYHFREHGYVVMAPPCDREKGMKWELTGWGEEALKKELNKYYFCLKDDLHIYHPLGNR